MLKADQYRFTYDELYRVAPAEGVVFYRLKPVFEGAHQPYLSEVIRYDVEGADE